MKRGTDLPGRMIGDSERCAFGLGWEYRRRAWPPELAEAMPPWREAAFLAGYESFCCKHAEVNNAMMRGVISPP